MPDSLYETLHETKSHYNTDFSYNTYPCTIPQDFAVVPLHWHNEMELIYIKEGKGLVKLSYRLYQKNFCCLHERGAFEPTL